MTMRDEFEKWYASKYDGFCPSAFEGEYDWADAQICWEAWQESAKSSSAGAVPEGWREVLPPQERVHEGTDDEYQYCNGWNCFRFKAIKALESLESATTAAPTAPAVEGVGVPEPSIGDAFVERVLYEEQAKQKECGVTGCKNQATHTWSGHPTCDDCGSPGRPSSKRQPITHPHNGEQGGESSVARALSPFIKDTPDNHWIVASACRRGDSLGEIVVQIMDGSSCSHLQPATEREDGHE